MVVAVRVLEKRERGALALYKKDAIAAEPLGAGGAAG